MKAYWSLRTNTTSSGFGSADSSMPSSPAACLTIGASELFSTPIGITSRRSVSMTGMSMLTLAIRPSFATVGQRAKYSAPSRPFSSAVSAMNSCERFGRGAAMAWRAASIRMALPKALSKAPL